MSTITTTVLKEIPGLRIISMVEFGNTLEDVERVYDEEVAKSEAIVETHLEAAERTRDINNEVEDQRQVRLADGIAEKINNKLVEDLRDQNLESIKKAEKMQTDAITQILKINSLARERELELVESNLVSAALKDLETFKNKYFEQKKALEESIAKQKKVVDEKYPPRFQTVRITHMATPPPPTDSAIDQPKKKTKSKKKNRGGL